MSNPATYFLGSSIVQKPAPASVPSTIAPIFLGIAGSVPQNDGSFLISWLSATGSALAPIRYEIYSTLGPASPATLFQQSNICKVVQNGLSSKIFTLGDGSTCFVKNQQYTFGVRAVSSSGISESNVVVLTQTAIASGNLADIFQTLVSQFENTQNDFENTALGLSITASSIAGGAGTEISLETAETTIIIDMNENTETTMTIDMDGVP
jgi:hypothetical protein